MNAQSRLAGLFAFLDHHASGRFDHGAAICQNLLRHVALILTMSTFDVDQRDAPLVRFRPMESHAIFGVGQHFPKAVDKYHPGPELSRPRLQIGPDARNGKRLLPPSHAHHRALIAVAPDIILPLLAQIAESRDVDARRPPTGIIAVRPIGKNADGGQIEDMIHQVSAKHS